MPRDRTKARTWAETNLAAGAWSGLVGYGLLWFANLANNFPHNWGWVWFVLSVLAMLVGILYLEKYFWGGISALVVGALSALLVIFGIFKRPFDDKLLSWTLGIPAGYTIMLAFALVGMLTYRALCSRESPNAERMRRFVKTTIVLVVIGSALLGLLAGLLGIQTVPPTLW